VSYLLYKEFQKFTQQPNSAKHLEHAV